MRIQDKTKIYDIKKGIRIYIEIYEIIYLNINIIINAYMHTQKIKSTNAYYLLDSNTIKRD